MSVYFDILDQIRSSIGTHVDLTGVGTASDIASSHIVLRHRPPGGEAWVQDEDTPGILITPGMSIDVPQDRGTNNTDDVWYPVAVQIIDRDHAKYDADRFKSWLKWLENIRKFLNQQNLRNAVFTSAGYVDLAICTQEEMLDRRLFAIHKLAVFVIGIKVLSREPRTASGSL